MHLHTGGIITLHGGVRGTNIAGTYITLDFVHTIDTVT